MRPQRRLDLAVIGCGAVVDGLYRTALRKVESRGIARVAVLVDPNPARTAALQRHFRSARAFATTDEAFASSTPDLVIVASPPGRHAEHAAAAFDAGSNVLCEKPMAPNVADAERMLAAAHRTDRVLAVGMVRRMFPNLAAARAILGAGGLGDDLRFVYREGLVYSWPVSTDAAFRRATAGGGVLTDFGSHAIDFLAALLGTPTVTAYADDAYGDGVETNCRIELEFPHASGVMQLSWSQPLVTGLRIVGSKGELTLDPARVDAGRWRRHGDRWQALASTVGWPSDLTPAATRRTPRTYYDCIHDQLVLAMRAVALGEPVPAGGAEGLAVARAIELCYAQARPLHLPWLTADEQAQAEQRHWSGERCAAA